MTSIVYWTLKYLKLKYYNLRLIHLKAKSTDGTVKDYIYSVAL